MAPTAAIRRRYAVTAFDRSETRLVAARGQGISIASSPAEAVSRRPVVITSLPDDAALRAVIVGPEGLVQAMAPKSIPIETSTVSAEVSGEVAAATVAHDIAYLRAPVSGKRRHRSPRCTDLRITRSSDERTRPTRFKQRL